MPENKWTGAKSTKWENVENWSQARVPLAEDDVVLEGAVNCELGGSPRKCRSLRGSGYTGKLKVGAGSLTVGDGTAGASGVALNLTGVAYEAVGSGAIIFASTAAAQQTLTFGGAVIRGLKGEATGASYLLEDELKMKENTDLFDWRNGIFTSNSKTMDIGALASTGATTRTLNIEGSLVKLKQETGIVWNFTTVTNLTFAGAGSTIEAVRTGAISNAEAPPQFIGGGKTQFGTLKLAGGATGEQPGLEVTGTNTFQRIINNSAAKPKPIEGSISGTTLTVTSGAGNIRRFSGLTGAGVTAGTQIIKEITPTTFEVSVSQTVAAGAMEVFAPGLILPAGVTTTVSEGYEGNGESGKPARLTSSTSGTQATLKKTGEGSVSVDWQRIRDSKVDTSPLWYAGANSVLANTTNWKNEAPTTGSTVAMLI